MCPFSRVSHGVAPSGVARGHRPEDTVGAVGIPATPGVYEENAVA